MVDDYNRLYQQLKEIYWPQFSNIWFEETNTDPEKFIHEDIAIACYLILTWHHLKLNIQNFVDLGCGNGLLVFILNDQGYSGYGVDMRRRKIWDNEFYAKLNVKLHEKTIDAQTSTYPDCDWLIGNHSDELSPWLPIIAHKTTIERKSDCNFVLIPCCLFDFYSKFEAKSKNHSRFDTYVGFLENVANESKYRVYKDKLRIPSTRNVCLIGLRDDSLEQKLENPIRKRIEAILNGQLVDEFKPRDIEMENAKSSRNCTKNVDNQIKQFILEKVLDNILNNENGDCKYHEKWDGSQWNSGRIVKIDELVRLFDKELLAKLKQECGGIKTLLKNYHQLFEIYERENVKLRLPKQACQLKEQTTQIKKKKKTNNLSENKSFFKTKRCLFDFYHPNGCFLTEDQCSFIHVAQL
jgi:tRNASer (uridine44-2'-O)-methyltransferase